MLHWINLSFSLYFHHNFIAIFHCFFLYFTFSYTAVFGQSKPSIFMPIVMIFCDYFTVSTVLTWYVFGTHLCLQMSRNFVLAHNLPNDWSIVTCIFTSYDTGDVTYRPVNFRKFGACLSTRYVTCFCPLWYIFQRPDHHGTNDDHFLSPPHQYTARKYDVKFVWHTGKRDEDN